MQLVSHPPSIQQLQPSLPSGSGCCRDACCRHNPLNIFAAHEVAAFCDGSMATKMTVQFNLFGGRPWAATCSVDWAFRDGAMWQPRRSAQELTWDRCNRWFFFTKCTLAFMGHCPEALHACPPCHLAYGGFLLLHRPRASPVHPCAPHQVVYCGIAAILPASAAPADSAEMHPIPSLAV